MRGKSVFTAAEADLIKKKLDECNSTSRYDNSLLYTKLRTECQFFISDFDRSRKGFTSNDFDHHVSIGNIVIND